MQIKEISAKSILKKTKLPENICPGNHYIINPFIGCLYGCTYCFAAFMRRFSKHKEVWSGFVDVKVNAVEVLKRELERNPASGIIEIGSVTDAYQPVEEKYQITKSILELLVAYDFPVSIVTKSNLVTRDVALLKMFSQCDVGVTITCLNSDISKTIEPGAPSPDDRLEVLRTLSRSGIRTFALVSPILPIFTDLRRILHEVSPYVDLIVVDKLNTRGISLKRLQDSLPFQGSEITKEFMSLIGDIEYWNAVQNEIRVLSTEFKVAVQGVGCFSGLKCGVSRWF